MLFSVSSDTTMTLPAAETARMKMDWIRVVWSDGGVDGRVDDEWMMQRWANEKMRGS